MKRPQSTLLPLFLLPFLLAACQASAPGADAASPAPVANAAGTPSAEAVAAAASAAAAAGAQPAVATNAPQPVDLDTPVEPVPAAGLDSLRPGLDYAEIPGGRPYDEDASGIEVVEVFNYICPACASFEPSFSAWKARLPADVRVAYVAAPWGPQWIPYARAFYVADAMGLDAKTHSAMFNAIHVQQSLPGEGQKPDEQKIAAFYAGFGANAKRFAADMHSFGIDAKIKRGQQFITQSQVGGTPTLIVAGKYRVLGRSYEGILRNTDALIARERAARQ